MELFFNTFQSLFQSVLMIFLIAGIAAVLVKRHILADSAVKSLSQVTVQILLPCLIFSSIAGHLDIAEFPSWWMIPLLAVGTMGIGFGMAMIVFSRKWPQQRSLLPLSSMMNAGYFVLPIGQAIFPDQFDTFALYVSLYILGVNPVLWSIGKLYMTTGGEARINWKELVTPPLVANLSAILFVLTGLNRFIPELVMNTADMLGDATVAMATLILGATFGKLSFKNRIKIADVTKVVIIKLLFVPGVILAMMVILKLDFRSLVFRDLIILEAASPAATALILQIRRYGGDEISAGSIMFVSYLVCLITVPLWLTLVRIL